MAAELCRCPYCGRERIVVDRRTGWRMGHYRIKGHKSSGTCEGANKHRDTKPEPGLRNGR